MKNLTDFVALLNYLEFRIYKTNLKPLNIKYLYYLSKTKDDRYVVFEIPKKNGKTRKIKSPDKLIKRAQSLINLLLQIIFENHSHYSTNGFLLGKDIRRNAVPHINKNYLLNIDIKNYFPSINFRRVKVVLELAPFNLRNERETIGFLIANLCTHGNSLPQGAPTSPILSNIVTQNLDRKLSKFSNENRIKYTRYADDLSFSSNWNIFKPTFIKEIEKIVNSENFSLNSKKTRVRSFMQRQEVTGLIVNTKLNVKREYLQKVRAMLNNWEKGGLYFATSRFKAHQTKSKKNLDFKEVLLGHLSFLKLIKGEDNQLIKRLLEKYNNLYNQIEYGYIDIENVEKKLIEDNLKMEKIFLDQELPDKDKFISFCTIAFHQIENLLNYYYYRKFENFEDLLNELIINNPKFKKRYRTTEKANQSFKKISDLNINVLVFIYEKEFFFDKKISYDKHITMLREIRNDDSHRCSVIDFDKEEIIKEYQKIEKERKGKESRGKNFEYSNQQARIKLNYDTLKFLDRKNYKSVRYNLKNISSNIRNTLHKKELS
ncbi:reverse transcriptase domain-containing protein [Dokdonia donghaensis]|uniref:reverse transcriptase domain-containing protein n=1 Tax=Dokdonia donghaensis TaxID=326320 RepID=UPI0007DDD3DE|nr:reverse transcriptase domain-containing protein [Dokdonia donghaensis]ANH61728.1 Reverse transcriptase (RNA-dependent DNA polymerase) [Dokdonia donghaensis DSW-1]